jgi:hypothetical protein
MRKLALPLLAACAVFAVSVPAASAAPLGKKLSQVSGALKGLQKAVGLMDDINKGQTGSIHDVDTRVTTVVGNLTSLNNKVDAVVAVATDALTKLQAGLTGLAQSTAAAAGSGDPNSATTTTTETSSIPAVKTSTLATGTLYRQIVLSTGARGPVPVGAPIGARTWIKMPDVAALSYSNTWVCTSAGQTSTATAVGYAVSCTGGTA